MENKTYETWEMVKMLTENPKLTFKAINIDDGEYETVSVAGKRICWGGKYEFPLYVVVGKEADNWELVEVPKEVTFVEAVEAFGEGNPIYCEWKCNKYIYKDFDMGFKSNDGLAVCYSEIKEGKWYIGEPS